MRENGPFVTSASTFAYLPWHTAVGRPDAAPSAAQTSAVGVSPEDEVDWSAPVGAMGRVGLGKW